MGSDIQYTVPLCINQILGATEDMLMPSAEARRDGIRILWLL